MHHSSGLLPFSQNVWVSHCACLFWQLLCALPSLAHQATALSFTPGGRTLLVVYSDHTVCGCVWVCVCECVCMCLCVCVCVCAGECVRMWVWVHMYAGMYMYVCIFVSECMWPFVCMHMFVFNAAVHVYVCV